RLLAGGVGAVRAVGPLARNPPMPAGIAPLEDRRNLGIGVLIDAQLFFAVLVTSAKYMAVSGIPTFEIVFVRYAVHLALLLALVMPVRGTDLFRTGSWKLELIRGLCLAAVTATTFYAM